MQKAHIFALLWAAVLGVLLGTASHAQSPQFPQTLPPDTVLGRIGSGVPGPAQAIPFATLGAKLFSLPPSFSANVPIIFNGTTLVGSAKSGSTNTFGTTNGTLTNGHCVGIDASGNLVDEGGPCTTSGGGGTVTSGGPNQLAIYSSAGATVVGAASLPFNVILGSTAQQINMLGIPTIGFNTWLGTSGNDAGGGGANVFLGPGAGPHSDANTYASSGSLGTENIIIGYVAGQNLTTGSANTMIGGGSGTQITTGAHNTVVGRHSQRSNHAGNDTVAIGEFANNGNDGAPALGLFSLTGHVDNGSGGTGSLLTVTAISGTPLLVGMHVNGTGLGSIACEIISLGSGTGGTGTYNLDCTGNTGSQTFTAALADASQGVFIGTNAGYYAADANPSNGTDFSQSVAIGYKAYFNGFTGEFNTAVGHSAMKGDNAGVTGSHNTALGYQACVALSTGAQNTCIGDESGVTGLTTASNNVFVGNGAGYQASGANNTIIGRAAGSSVTSGTDNLIIASGGGSFPSTPGITTGQYNVVIGYNGTGLSTSLSNGIVLGDGQGNIRADYGSTNAGGWTLAGKTFLPAIGTDATKTDATVCEDTTTHQLYFGSGSAGICLGTSSLRFKHDVASLDVGLSQIMALEPISYKVNADHGDPNKTLYGFSAEQGGTVLPKLMGKDSSGQPNTFDYMGVVPVLVKALQEQQAEIEQLKRQLHQ